MDRFFFYGIGKEEKKIVDILDIIFTRNVCFFFKFCARREHTVVKRDL
jgi:hypothetical protein